MRTVVSSSEVPHLWAHQTQSEARNGKRSLYFVEKTIYSYGSHFPIATFTENSEGKTAVLFTTRRHSVTTSQHCSNVRSSIQHLSPVFNVPLRSHYHIPSFVEDYAERIAEQSAKVARSKANREWQFSTLHALVDEANAFCEFFGLPNRFSVPTDFEALRSTLAKVAAEKAAEERKRKRRIAEQAAEAIAQWIAGENVQLPYSLDKVYLRIEGTDVVTSRGARFPVDHARRGLEFVRTVKRSGQEYRRNGHTLHLGPYAIDSIDANGNVKAGCHYVTYAEVERIAPQLDALAGAS